MDRGNYQELVEQVQQQALKFAELEYEQRLLKQKLRHAEENASRRALQARAVVAFATSALGVGSESRVYQLLCQALVHELKWDAALVIGVGQNTELKGSFHLTQRQHRLVTEQLNQLPKFLDIYAHREHMSTNGSSDGAALALRSIFQTDEVVVVPLSLNSHLFGYGVACSHTERNLRRTPDDFYFLKSMANLAVKAVASLAR